MSYSRWHLGIFGAGGSGKTTYAKKFIAHAQATCVYIFDPDGEFAEGMHILPCRTPYEIDQAIPQGWVCFDPHTMFPGNLEGGLVYLCELAMRASALQPGRKLFVCDELQFYVTGSTIPQPLRVLVQTGGRRWGIHGVWIAQGPNELHNTVRAQLKEVVCFQLVDDCALEYPKKFGFDVEAVRRLQPYHYICRTTGGGEARG